MDLALKSVLQGSHEMEFTTENLALLAAITSIWAFIIALLDSRRNNRIILKIVEIESTYSKDRIGPQRVLRVRIKNCGISLQSITMSLGFHGPEQSGFFSVPMKPSPVDAHHSQFLRGSVATFELSTRNNDADTFLSLLDDICLQRPKFMLFNGSYLARSFRIVGSFDRFKVAWNRLVFKFCFHRRVGNGIEGKGVFKLYHLPAFEILSEKLRFFLKRDEGTAAEKTPAL